MGKGSTQPPPSCKTPPRLCLVVLGQRLHAARLRAQLFTGNTAFLPVAVIEGRASVAQLAVNWGASFVGNLAGALLAVAAVTGAGLLGQSGPAIPVALAKVSLPFGQARTGAAQPARTVRAAANPQGGRVHPPACQSCSAGRTRSRGARPPATARAWMHIGACASACCLPRGFNDPLVHISMACSMV